MAAYLAAYVQASTVSHAPSVDLARRSDRYGHPGVPIGRHSVDLV